MCRIQHVAVYTECFYDNYFRSTTFHDLELPMKLFDLLFIVFILQSIQEKCIKRSQIDQINNVVT